MWNPRCFGNPGKVSDTFEYTCSPADDGGVHANSGVPNHAYALLVDGGIYNGQTISAIGLTKAAHIYFRAMSVYQHPSSDFPDHADRSSSRRATWSGVNLADLNTGLPSGQSDHALATSTQVQKAMLAVEMRDPPTQCGFQPPARPEPAGGPRLRRRDGSDQPPHAELRGLHFRLEREHGGFRGRLLRARLDGEQHAAGRPRRESLLRRRSERRRVQCHG